MKRFQGSSYLSSPVLEQPQFCNSSLPWMDYQTNVSGSGSLFADDLEGFLQRNITPAITIGLTCLKQTVTQAVKRVLDEGVWPLRPSGLSFPAQRIPPGSRAGAAPQNCSVGKVSRWAPQALSRLKVTRARWARGHTCWFLVTWLL